MPQIPGLPVDEPVALPKAKPAQFGSVGEAVAGLGEESEQLAQSAADVEEHLAAANRQLKYKQAEIAVKAVQEQTHLELEKAQTPEEADAIRERFSGEATNALQPFETGDRQLSRILGVYQQQISAEVQNTTNAAKASIISKSDHLATEKIGEDKLREGINTWVGGGDPSVATKSFEMVLQSGVEHRTFWPQEAEQIMTKFNKELESGYIEAQINGTDVQQIQNTVNDIRLHPEHYSHLTKQELEVLSNKGEQSIVSRLSINDEINAKSEQSKYWNNSATGIPKLFTDPDGNFDEDKAASYVSKLGLSPQGEEKLLRDISTHGAATVSQFKKQAVKNENDILKLLTDRNYTKANTELEGLRPWLEQHGFGAMYKSLLTYKDQKQREDRAEAQQARSITTWEEAQARQKIQEQSQAQLSQISIDLQSGKQYTDAQIRSMAGEGKGKMLTPQVDAAIRMSHAFTGEDDPINKAYFTSIKSVDYGNPAINGRIINDFSDYLRLHPDATPDEKTKAVKEITDPEKIKLINDHIDSLGDVLNSPASRPSTNPSAPKATIISPGTVVDGYKYIGGDPSNQSNWEKAK